jgi:hypothetical protein
MNPVRDLSNYLDSLQARWRWTTWLRSFAAAALLAAVITVIGAAIANQFDFSQNSILWGRWALFVSLAGVVGLVLIAPLMRLNRQTAARFAEQRFPQLNQRLLTFVDRQDKAPEDPFLPLLATEASGSIASASPQVAFPAYMWLILFLATALGLGSLNWMIQSGPGWLGQGAGLLWTGSSRLVGEKALYQLTVEPGNLTVRNGGDQPIRARLQGLTIGTVQLHTLTEGSSKWETVPMQALPDTSSYEFLFAGMNRSLEYYVTAGPLKSPTYKLTVLELPNVQQVKLRLVYPAWTGLPPAEQDTSADVRAVAGTVVRVQVIADRPMPNGLLKFSSGDLVALKQDGSPNIFFGEFTVQKEGVYSIATKEKDEVVRLTEDFFIEPIKEQAPEIKLLKPAADMKVSPIEEIRIEVQASDDFGLRDLQLAFSVNGGPEQVKKIGLSAGSREATGSYLLQLEEYKLVPGDIVSVWAIATDAKQSITTDIRFLTAQPFERNVTQNQASGGGGEQQQQEGGISERQKEIIAATWNAIRKPSNNKEVAQFLSEQQAKLSEQTKSLSKRMKSREIAGQGQDFKKFAEYLDLAATFMDQAKGELSASRLKEALPQEQKALQNIERAEAIFKDIQVQMSQSRGSQGQSAERDLSSLFDMELDTEKNQYETGRNQSAQQQQQQVDKALERLKELARRQKELAERAQQNKLNFQQKYEQDMLRREAEELRKQMEDLMKQQQQQQQANGGQQNRQQSQSQSQNQSQSQSQSQSSSSGQQQSGQQGQQRQQSGQQNSQQSGQTGQQQQQRGNQQAGQQQSGQQSQRRDSRYNADSRMNEQTRARLQESLNRLDQAIKDMKDAQGNQANARRAAERLQEMSSQLGQARRQENAGELRDLAEQAKQLAEEQRNFERKLNEQFSPENQARMGMGTSEARRTGQALAQEKLQMKQQLEQLEVDLQKAIRQMQADDANATSKMKQSLAEMQQNDTNLDMQAVAQYLRRGLGQMAQQRDAKTTRSLNRLAEGLAQAQREAGKSGQADQNAKGGKPADGQSDTQKALDRVESLRRQLEQMAGRSGQQPGARQGAGQQAQNGPLGRQQAANSQNGSQRQAGQQGKPGSGDQKSGQQNQSQSGQQEGQSGNNQEGSPSAGQSQRANQPNGNSPGGEGRGGQQQAGQQGGRDSSPVGGSQAGGGSYSATNFGDRRMPDPGNPNADGQSLSPQQLMQEMAALSRQLSGDPESAQELRQVLQRAKELSATNFGESQELAARVAQQLLPQVQKLELQLRKKADPNSSGQIRVGQRPGPPSGFSEAVAEYFRRLSKGS